MGTAVRECTPVHGNTAVCECPPVCRCPVIPCGGSQLNRSCTEAVQTAGEALGRPLSVSPPGNRVKMWADEVVHRRAVGVEGGMLRLLRMQHWVLFPLWGKGGQGCPVLGPQAAARLFWVHLGRLLRGALQLCPPHRALGL